MAVPSVTRRRIVYERDVALGHVPQFPRDTQLRTRLKMARHFSVSLMAADLCHPQAADPFL